MNLDGVDPVSFAVALSQLPPTHPLVAAARAAVDVAKGRHERQQATTEAAHDIAAATRRQDLAGSYLDTVTMWKARAEVDGPSSRSAAKAAEVQQAPVPDPRPPAGSERRAETAALVAEARAFVAAQEIAAEERLHDVMEHHWRREDGHDDEAARWRVR